MNILFRKLKRGKVSGQIVVLVILLVAVTVVFIAAMINLAKIAQLKAFLNTAVRGAAIGLASTGSSYGLALMINSLQGEEESCKPSAFAQFLIDAAMLAAAVWASLAVLGDLVAAGIKVPAIAYWAVYAGAALGGYAVIQDAFNNVQTNATLKKQIAELSNLDQRTTQDALQSAIFGIVGDPVARQDVHDLDNDTLTDDKVGRFQQFYEARLYHLLKHGAQKQLKDAVDAFQPHWKDFEVFLSAGYKTDDCNNIVPSSYGTSGFMSFLGEDKGVPVPLPPFLSSGCNPGTTTGLYKLFYDIRSWGFNNFNIGTRKVWEPDNAPCSFLCPGNPHPRCSSPRQQYCQLPSLVGQTWVCMSPPPATDELDNLRYNLYDFAHWAGQILFWCDALFPFPTMNCDPMVESNLIKSYQSWYGKLFLDSEKISADPAYSPSQSTYSLYCIMPQWLSVLDDLDVVLRNAFTYTVRTRCVDSHHRQIPCSDICTNGTAPPCPSGETTWQEQLDRINSARTTINEARIQVSNFIETVSELISKVEAIDWHEDNKVTYSWFDALGWHHVFASVEHFTMPHLYYDDGSFWENCTYLDPSYCGRRGGGAGKVRVIRYDQDQQHPLKFLSGSPLWRFLYSNPKATGTVTPPQGLTGCDCGGEGGGTWQIQHPDTGCPTDSQAGINCNEAKDALLHGVKSQSCVEWGPYAVPPGQPNPGDYTRFIDCGCYDSGNCQCPTIQ